MPFQVVVARDLLYRELQRLHSIVEERNTLPILAHILISGGGERLDLAATNLEISYRSSIPAKVEDPGSITLEARKAHDIVRELAEGGEVYMGSEKEGWAVLRSGQATFRIGTLPAEDFPALPQFEDEGFSDIGVGPLREMIAKTHFAISASPEEQRKSLNGALLIQEGDKLEMVATDGHRLALISREGGVSASQAIRAIVPRKALMEVRKLLDEARGGEAIRWKQEGSHVVFRHGDVTFFARVIDDRYPEYRQVIPKEHEKSLMLDREAFQRALRRVSVLSHEKAKPIILGISGGRLVVRSNTPDMGEATEELSVEYDGPEMDIGFNARYLLDVLGVIEEERVVLKLNEPLSSGVVCPVEDASYLCVVMPMRI